MGEKKSQKSKPRGGYYVSLSSLSSWSRYIQKYMAASAPNAYSVYGPIYSLGRSRVINSPLADVETFVNESLMESELDKWVDSSSLSRFTSTLIDKLNNIFVCAKEETANEQSDTPDNSTLYRRYTNKNLLYFQYSPVDSGAVSSPIDPAFFLAPFDPLPSANPEDSETLEEIDSHLESIAVSQARTAKDREEIQRLDREIDELLELAG